MHCPDCEWWQSYDDDPTVYCSFCGALMMATSDDPVEARHKVAQASGEVFDPDPASVL